MNPVRFLSLLAFMTVAGVAWAAESPTGVVATFVTLERTPCDGFCPGYTVSISSDGTVTFNGRAWVAKQGWATKQVPVAQLAPLFQKLREIDFWTIDGKSDGRKMQPNGDVIAGYPVDLPTYAVTVIQGGRSKRVQGLPGGRYAEGDLPELIDRVADIADWIKRSTNIGDAADTPRAAPARSATSLLSLPPSRPPAAPQDVSSYSPPPALAPSRSITAAVVTAPGRESTLSTPGQAPTTVVPLSGGSSVISTPGQPQSTVLTTPGGGSTVYTPGQSPTTITPISGGGSIINTPGQPPSTVVPTTGGGSTIYTPGQAPTTVVPISGGGSIIYAPGQPPVMVMPNH